MTVYFIKIISQKGGLEVMKWASLINRWRLALLHRACNHRCWHDLYFFSFSNTQKFFFSLLRQKGVRFGLMANSLERHSLCLLSCSASANLFRMYRDLSLKGLHLVRMKTLVVLLQSRFFATCLRTIRLEAFERFFATVNQHVSLQWHRRWANFLANSTRSSLKSFQGFRGH